jgi:hypothetical protein
MDRLERVQRTRAKLTKGQWEALDKDERDLLLFDLLCDETELLGDDFVETVFWKAYKETFGVDIFTSDFVNCEYAQLMAIFDLCERYAKNWIFA